jgi:hypothetical protein
MSECPLNAVVIELGELYIDLPEFLPVLLPQCVYECGKVERRVVADVLVG